MRSMIDVSNNNGATISSEFSKYDIICFKISEGNYFRDSFAKGFYDKAKELGKEVWVYHFANGTASVKEQYDFFKTYLDALGITPDKTVIDIETESQYSNFGGFLEYFDICYTMGSRLDQAKGGGWGSDRLWIADYGTQSYIGSEGKYKDCLAWQYTSEPYDKSVIYTEVSGATTTTTIGGLDDMEFLFKAKNGKDIYYHVSGKTIRVENPDYLTAIKAVYRQLNGKEISYFDWTDNATATVFVNQFK